MLKEMSLLYDSERYENAALRLKNGSCEDDGPSQVAKRAAARGAKEGSMVVSTVKETAETPLRG
jgi:hypothetical protein